jgi:hypothetical protein
MRNRHAWRTVSTVGLVLLSLAGPGWAQGTATRHSGTVAAVDRAAGTITIEAIGPWRVKDGQTVITRFTVKPDGSTVWTRARRAAGAGSSGWDGEFIEVPQDAWGLKPGEYATVELQRVGKRQVAARVTVSELDTQ